jgi:hypothetical protein
MQTTIEQASRLIMRFNHAEEVEIVTDLFFDAKLGCVEHLFRKWPMTKHPTDNAWLVEYLLDRYATQACRDLCDKVCTKLPQEIRDMIYPYLYQPLMVGVALRFFHDKERRGLAKKRQLQWTHHYKFYDSLLHRELCEEHCGSSAFSIDVDALAGRLGPSPSPQWTQRYTYRGPRSHLQLCDEYCRSSAFAFDADAFPGRWKSSRIPSDFVTTIKANIHCDEWCSRVESADTPRLEKSRGDLLFHLEFLLGFPPGTRVRLNLNPGRREDTRTYLDNEWLVEMIVPIILPVLDRYKAAGYVTRVVIEGHGRDFVVHEYLSLAEWKARFAEVRIIQAP